MARTDPSLVVRLPADLKEELRAVASKESRTITGQVIHILRRALPAETKEADAGATASASN